MSNIRRRLDRVMRILDEREVSREAFRKFSETTPVKTGNARRSTSLQGNQIQANYPYAGVLDKGRHQTTRGMRGSVQAPEGMSKPTIEHIRDYIQQRLGITIKWLL